LSPGEGGKSGQVLRLWGKWGLEEKVKITGRGGLWVGENVVSGPNGLSLWKLALKRPRGMRAGRKREWKRSKTKSKTKNSLHKSSSPWGKYEKSPEEKGEVKPPK